MWIYISGVVGGKAGDLVPLLFVLVPVLCHSSFVDSLSDLRVPPAAKNLVRTGLAVRLNESPAQILWSAMAPTVDITPEVVVLVGITAPLNRREKDSGPASHSILQGTPSTAVGPRENSEEILTEIVGAHAHF